MKKSLDTPMRYLKGIGPQRAKALNKLGIATVEDLFYYFPRRYEDRTKFCTISRLKEGEVQTVKAEILAKGLRRSFRKRGFSILEVAVGDDTGKIFCVWFNQPYLNEYFKPGDSLVLYGKVERYGSRLQMNSPEFEIVSGLEDESLNIGRIVPIYTLPEKMTQRAFRKMVKAVYDEYVFGLIDFLPYDIRARHDLLNSAQSIINMHLPDSPEVQKEAYRRLAFEEFFLFQLPLILRKSRKKEKAGIAHKAEARLAERLVLSLPFSLTATQQKVLEEIKSDMKKPHSMQRLLQGDVGSGKTVVATIACLIAIEGRYQAAFMAPTEILARQHFDKINSQLMNSGAPELKAIKVGLLTSGADRKEKDKIYNDIKAGKIDLLIGTHALLEEPVEFKNLGLVVIDEQHKFGVGQRALLPKKGVNPDVLIMTATPIPRTLAITLYGDLDISVIRELPPGRLAVETFHFPSKESSQAYALAKGELKAGRQVYIIFPVIEESCALDIAGAKRMYDELRKGEFRDYKLGLIHGRLKQGEQERVMMEFKSGGIDLLVATTVLEVGIDIPNATCMIIEHAERFGLSQLHQLRGRVGRGRQKSICLLISDTIGEEAMARLDAMVKYSDGFRIAEEDLKIRGPGEFFGKRQHGLAELKIANPLTQMQLLKLAREEAVKLATLDPNLELKQNLWLKEKLLHRFPEYEKLIVVG